MTFTTLDDHLRAHLRAEGGDQPGLRLVLDKLALAARQIAADLGRAGLIGLLGAAGATNVQGEDQKKLDVRADDLIAAQLAGCGAVCAMASEEHEAPLPVPDQAARDGEYVVLFDPLDGSSNIDAGIATGTIFAIYRRVTPRGTPAGEADLLQPGRQQVCGGYALYSSATMMVIGLAGRTDGFTLERELGAFVLSHPQLAMPARGKITSCNDANAGKWDPVTRAFVDERGGSSRYIGSLVADIHRNLLYGGLFLYPSDCSGEAPKPKLRLLYEGNPMAFVLAQAGGKGTTGHEAILDVQPTGLHQRVSLVLGGSEDIADYERAMGGIA